MIRVLHYLQTSQRWPPGYIVENVPIVRSLRLRTLESRHQIDGILGVLILIDAAAVCSHLWWTNMALAKLLQLAIGCIKWPNIYMSDILESKVSTRV
jgi:hypothetical protein